MPKATDRTLLNIPADFIGPTLGSFKRVPFLSPPAHRRDRPVLVDEGVLHSDCLSKYDEAIYRALRLLVTRFSSFCRRQVLACASVRVECSAESGPYFLSEEYWLRVVRLNRLVTWVTEWSRSATWRMTSILNPSGKGLTAR